jgi:transcriptional regulator with XRE-family HTH domain
MESLSQAFGRIVRERRVKLGMTQTQVAELTGKKQSQIVRLERGLADPRLSSLVQVANSLGMELMAVPSQLVPVVRRLLKEQDGVPVGRSRLVGNDPEDAEEQGDEF